MKKFIILIVLLAATSVSAQLTETAEINEIANKPSYGLKPAVSSFSLLDFSRIKWSNSYSVTYFSGGGSNATMGLLNTGMFYEFSSKLSLAVNIGISHNAGAIWGDANSSPEVLPSFRLDYKPSDNFHISVGMETYRGYLTPYDYNGLYNPYGRSLFYGR